MTHPDSGAVQRFVSFLQSLEHGEVGDGDMILVEEDAGWICQTGDDGRDRMYPLSTGPEHPMALEEVLGYDEVPEDRRVKSFERMWTTSDVARLAQSYLTALTVNATTRELPTGGALAQANRLDAAARGRARALGGCDGLTGAELDMLLDRGPRTEAEAKLRRDAEYRDLGLPIPPDPKGGP